VAFRGAGALLVLALCPALAWAQNLEPREYANTPIGMNFAIAGYAYSNGDVGTDASLPLSNAHVQVHSGFLAYARSFDLLGKSAKFDVRLPYAGALGSADVNVGTGTLHEARDVDGFGDPVLRVSWNLVGAPALSLEDFASYKQDVIVGTSLKVTVPLSQYDHDKLLNVGTHRWSFQPEIGISKSWDPFILEMSLAGTFYTENHDFFHGNDRAQSPLGAAQLHGIYAFRSGIWGSIDFTYYMGGRVSLNDQPGTGLQSNTRLGGTIAIPINRYNSIKLLGSTGVSARAGGRFDTIAVAWQVRWGAGL
jgi:outer membrane putative beta-barrel porin/alpha-amylase